MSKQITEYRIEQTNNKCKLRPIIAVLKLRSRNIRLLNKLTDSNAQQNFKTPFLVKISVMISKSLDMNSSQNIRK